MHLKNPFPILVIVQDLFYGVHYFERIFCDSHHLSDFSSNCMYDGIVSLMQSTHDYNVPGTYPQDTGHNRASFIVVGEADTYIMKKNTKLYNTASSHTWLTFCVTAGVKCERKML